MAGMADVEPAAVAENEASSGAAPAPLLDVRALLKNEVDQRQQQAVDTWAQAEDALSVHLKQRDQDSRSSPPAVRRRQLPEWTYYDPRTDQEARKNVLARIGVVSPTPEEDAAALAATEERIARLAARREKAPAVKEQFMKQRGAQASEFTMYHGKRALRTKIGELLREVERRQAYQQAEGHRCKAREHRAKRLGFKEPPSCREQVEIETGLFAGTVSPRRACILDSVSNEELDMLRQDPWYFFEGLAEKDAIDLEASVQLGTSTKTASTTTVSLVETNMEVLIDFFAPDRDDKEIPIEAYAKKLRADIVNSADFGLGLKDIASLSTTSSMSGSKGVEPCASSVSLFSLPPPPVDHNPDDRMPCLVRRRPLKGHEQSPILQGVMEVYKKRDELDEAIMQDRRATMDRRHAINSFKAHEQQREEQLKTMQQVELHNIRMAEAEERKAIYDEAAQEKLDALEVGKLRRLVKAAAKADMHVEKKREKAMDALEVWRAGVERAERYTRHQELSTIEAAEAKWSAYTARLWKIGADRHHAPLTRQRQDARLKFKIQKALVGQLDEKRKEEGAARIEALEARLEAAAERRKQGLMGSRYNLIETAFGSSALGFDAKHHSVHVDRRSSTWRRNVKAWESQKEKLSMSDPNLPTMPWAAKAQDPQAASTTM